MPSGSQQRPAPLEDTAETPVGSQDKAVSLAGLLAEIEAAGIVDVEDARADFSSASFRAGSRIRGMRKRAGLSQQSLADILGVSQARVSELEAGLGRNGPTWDVMERIAAACDFDIAIEPRLQTEFGNTQSIGWSEQLSVMDGLRSNLDERAFQIEAVDDDLYMTTRISASEVSTSRNEDYSIKVVFKPVAFVKVEAQFDEGIVADSAL